MTTEMYRSGKRLRLLVNDPNVIIREEPNRRSIADVLNRIASREKLKQSLGADTKSHTKSDNKSDTKSDTQLTQTSNKGIHPNNAFKRQKRSEGQTERQTDRQTYVGSNQSICDDSCIRVFKVIYGIYKPNKKHKQFSSDGFLTLSIKNSIRLYSMEGKGISEPKLLKNIEQIESGNRLVVGSRELEIDEEVSALDFKNKKLFVQSDD